MTAVTRLRQGVRALLAFTQPVDESLARRYLTGEQMALFQQLSRSERLHSLNVLRGVLQQSAHTPHDLAVAALLHDIGKIRCRLSVWQKTAAVLARRLLPAWERRWRADHRLDSWRAPFIVRARHPAWGGDIVREAGASPRVIWLVAHHADPAEQWHDHPYVALLRRLQQADDLN